MKNSSKIISSILLVFGILFLSCKRDKFDPYFGSQACPDENFEIISAFELNKSDGDTVNFKTVDSLYFSANFSSSARWKIILSGRSSHASDTIEGISSFIDTAWYGRAGSDLFFSDEIVDIDFQIICKPELSSHHEVSIIKPDFAHDPTLKLLTNFNVVNSVFPSGWIFYEDSDPTYGSGVADTVWCRSSSVCSNYTPSQEGGGYLKFIGTSPIPNGDSKGVYGTYEVYPPNLSSLDSDPNKVWFNFLANTEGVPAKIVVTFKHWDAVQGFGRKVISINSSEWTMFSINLGSLDKSPTDLTTFNAKDTGLIFFTVIQSGGIAPTTFNIDIPNFTKGNSFYGN